MNELPPEDHEVEMAKRAEELMRRVDLFWRRVGICATLAAAGGGYLVFSVFGLPGLLILLIMAVLIGCGLGWCVTNFF